MQGTGEKFRVMELVDNSMFVLRSVWSAEWRIIIAVSCLIAVSSVAAPLSSGILGMLVNSLSEEVKNVAYIYTILGVLIVTLSSIQAVRIYQETKMRTLRQYVQKKFENAVSEKKKDLDIATHESPELNDLLQKVSDLGISRTQDFFTRNFDILWDSVGVCTSMVIVASFNIWILGLIFMLVFPSLLVEMYSGNKIWRMYSERAPKRRRYAEIRRHFNYVGGLMEINIFQNGDHLLRLLKDALNLFFMEERREYGARARLRFRVMHFSHLAIALALMFFVHEVISGQMKIGSLVFVYAAITGFKSSLTDLFSGFGRQYEDSLFVSDMRKFLALEPKLKKEEFGIKLINKAPSIEFRNVSFRYSDRLPFVLENVSFRINSGETAAFVGLSGSGKSTIIKLIFRLYDPTIGTILIDGHDIRSIDIDSYYKKSGMLSQDYPCYRFPVGENISMGDVTVPISEERLNRAAILSGANEFIDRWPERYARVLGKEFSGGADLSRGEWQRIALARVFYRNPKLIVLDEPTASVDALVEAEIFNNLMKMGDSTRILVSHRFSTIKKADKIFVVEEGKISESGTHKSLMKNSNAYYRLFTLQAEAYLN